jgi:type VI secretion system secreted protein Hcp
MFDAFLVFTGSNLPTGETTDTAFASNIAIKSFDFGVSNNSSVSSDKPGSGSGKPSLSNLNFTKFIDNASPDLFQACCTGNHFPTAQLNIRKSGGGQGVYMTIDLTEVYVSSYSCNGSEGSEIPFESGSLTFQKIRFTYKPQATTGTEATPNIKGYDLTTNSINNA